VNRGFWTQPDDVIPPENTGLRDWPGPKSPAFQTTLWTEVIEAGDPSTPTAQAALARLCQRYWIPVYAFIRKRGHSPESAEDLVQGFFARFMEKGYVTRADRERGRFRSFLMTSVEHFLHDAHDHDSRIKRGGGADLVSLDACLAEKEYSEGLKESMDPASAFEALWANTLLDQVFSRLAAEYRENGKSQLFDSLQPHLWGDSEATPYSGLAQRLGLSVVNVRVLGHRMRQRFRELLHDEIGQTVASAIEVEGEIQFLLRVVSR
jgi:RNA polymerase sigma factor (sigma-70 family)